MKNLSIVGIAFLLLLSYACKQESTPPAVQKYTIEQFLDTKSIFGGSFSPDKKDLLVTSNQTGIYNAYTIPVEGGEMIPLTDSERNPFLLFLIFLMTNGSYSEVMTTAMRFFTYLSEMKMER